MSNYSQRMAQQRRRLTSVLAAVGWLVISSLCTPTAAAEKEPAGSFVIPAYAFDRGNAKTFTSQWADAEPMVAFGGDDPVVIEYHVNFPVPRSVRYSARCRAGTKPPGRCRESPAMARRSSRSSPTG